MKATALFSRRIDPEQSQTRRLIAGKQRAITATDCQDGITRLKCHE